MSEAATDDLCWLKTEINQCCCNCEYRLPVMHHCTTSSPSVRKDNGGCCCDKQKGWACVPPGLGAVHDEWPEHSCGCELYTPKIKAT